MVMSTEHSCLFSWNVYNRNVHRPSSGADTWCSKKLCTLLFGVHHCRSAKWQRYLGFSILPLSSKFYHNQLQPFKWPWRRRSKALQSNFPECLNFFVFFVYVCIERWLHGEMSSVSQGWKRAHSRYSHEMWGPTQSWAGFSCFSWIPITRWLFFVQSLNRVGIAVSGAQLTLIVFIISIGLNPFSRKKTAVCNLSLCHPLRAVILYCRIVPLCFTEVGFLAMRKAPCSFCKIYTNSFFPK